MTLTGDIGLEQGLFKRLFQVQDVLDEKETDSQRSEERLANPSSRVVMKVAMPTSAMAIITLKYPIFPRNPRPAQRPQATECTRVTERHQTDEYQRKQDLRRV